MEHELRRDAVDRAYRAHRDDVYRVAYAILRDTEAAVDAMHETFARAFERWHQYDSRRPLRPWLLGIAAHEALDGVRRRRVGLVALRSLARRAATPDDPEVLASRRQQVDEALSTLRPAVRAALVLRHYYGYDYAEIAAQLGTSPGNVGSMLSRAHAALRAHLVAAGAARPASGDGPRTAVR